jgi:hypothetical protein
LRRPQTSAGNAARVSPRHHAQCRWAPRARLPPAAAAASRTPAAFSTRAAMTAVRAARHCPRRVASGRSILSALAIARSVSPRCPGWPPFLELEIPRGLPAIRGFLSDPSLEGRSLLLDLWPPQPPPQLGVLLAQRGTLLPERFDPGAHVGDSTIPMLTQIGAPGEIRIARGEHNRPTDVANRAHLPPWLGVAAIVRLTF